MNHELSPQTKNNFDEARDARDSLLSFYCFVSFVVLLLSVACARPSGGAAPGPSTEKSAGPFSHLDTEEKIAMSEVLTDDAEEQMRFESLNESWGKFNEALELNPKNDRAIFWRELLKPVLQTKGLLARIRPMYLKAPNGLDRYTALRRQLAADNAPAFFNFLNDGPNDLDTDEKFLDWMDRAILSLDTLRTFIKNNKDKTYALHISENLVSADGGKNRRDGSCTALIFMATTFAGCPANGMFALKLNRADLEELQYLVSRQMVEFSMLYAYKLSPTKLIEGQRGHQSTKEFLEGLLKGYDGNLLARNHLELARSVLPDWIAAERFVIENQDELCNKKNGRKNDTVLCAQTSPINHEARNLELMESVLAGRPVEIEQSLLKSPVKVDVLKIFNQPPSSISEFFPNDYNEAGDPLKFNDAVYSPYFYQGDATSLWTAYHQEKKDLADKWQARENVYRLMSLGVAEESVLSSGEIVGFEYGRCELDVCIGMKAPRATLSRTDVIVARGDSDSAVKVAVSSRKINASALPKEYFGREAVLNPQSHTITVETAASVTTIDVVTGAAKIQVKTQAGAI